MDRVMRIGTRRSALALAQTRMFIEACRAVDDTAGYEIVEISTAGDRILDRPLYAFAGKGMFVSAFEEALLEGRIDVAVHSGKDIPAGIAEGLMIGAVLPRGNPQDVLVTVKGRPLPDNAVIGTASLRRSAQIRRLFGYETKMIRGNVGSRLRKLRDGEVDGLVLAAAGLERLGLLESPELSFHMLSVEEALPAAAQGIIAAECRRDTPFAALLKAVSDDDTMDCFLAEREYLRLLDAGCQQAVAAYARRHAGWIDMTAAYYTEDSCFRFYDRQAGDDGLVLAGKLAARIKCALCDAERKREERKRRGHVWLVGAGPGRRDLITVKGLELLRGCDVVVYDRLSGEELLAEVRPDCKRIDVGKQAGESVKQAEINRILVREAAKGRQVVRLKGGDPFVFGRGGEEAEHLMAEGISFTLIPGVTSAVAVAEAAGIPVTHRELSRSFHVITGHTAQTGEAAQLAYLRAQIGSLREAEGTFVFLMGLSALAHICSLFQTYGKPPSYPAAVIGSGMRYNETLVRGTLADLPQRVRAARIAAPAVIVVGETAALALRAKERPALEGIRVGIAGTAVFTEKLGRLLREAGAETLVVQRLFTEAPASAGGHAAAGWEDSDWVVFTSANGVAHFFQRMTAAHMDLRLLGGKRFAVVGRGTAAALEAHGIYADYIPEIYTARHLAQGLAERLCGGDEKVLLFQARDGNPVLESTLRDAGIAVRRVVAYETYAEPRCGMEELTTLSYLAFGSASGVEAFCRENPHIFEERAMQGVRMAAIGQQTAQALNAAGSRNCLTAACFTAEGLRDAILADRERTARE